MSEIAPLFLSARQKPAGGSLCDSRDSFPLPRRLNPQLFQIEARFTGFTERKHGLPRRMMVQIGERFCSVKISKMLRPRMERRLNSGARLQICGEAKWDRETGECKLKAHAIEVLDPGENAAPAKPCILVCSERNCCQRGAPLLWKTLKSALDKCGLSERVTLESTGCLKNCKRGPSFMVLPEATVHGGVNTGLLNGLLGRQFT
jgi:hypothetical protein